MQGANVTHAEKIVVELMRIRSFWMDTATELAKAVHCLTKPEVLDRLKCAELSAFIWKAYEKQAHKEHAKTGIVAKMWKFFRQEKARTSKALSDDYELCTSFFHDE